MKVNEFAYGVLAGLPAGAAAMALAGRLATAFKSKRQPSDDQPAVFDTMTPEQRRAVYEQAAVRHEELKVHADKLADGDPRLRQMLGFN